MGYILTQTSVKGFTRGNKTIEKEIIDVAVEHVRESGVISFSKETPVKFRMDCTDEVHKDKDGKSEKVIKIQVQRDRETYSSVTIRKSAADRRATDLTINSVIADAIMKSYLEQAAYEVSYSE